MIEVIETLWIPMPDDTKLAARLWLPEDARTQPVPALLEYIPYRRRDRTRLRDEGMHPHFAQCGYASIRVDMRGSGDSEGVMLDEYTDIETQDGVDVIAWIADQPWCDGYVGMFGKSWGAYNSFQVAAKRPPALKAIAPVMGTDDRWLEDIHFYGGVLANDNFWWGSIMQLYNAFPPDPQVVGKRWREMWKQRLAAMTYWPAQWLEHQTHDEMWQRGSISENYDDVQIPVYFFGGWADLFRDTPFRIAEHLKGKVKILIGPWAHLYPHEGIPAPPVDFLGEVTRFWDHYLKGLDTGLMDEPRFRFYLQDSIQPSASHRERAGHWVEESVWPSPNVVQKKLYLNAEELSVEARRDADLTICSPQTFGSAGGDMCSFAIAGDMPADCRLDAGGALCFRAATLQESLDILGQPSLQLKVKADKPQGFVVALLIDEAPDGAQNLISRGFVNLTHRYSDTAPQAIVPGEIMTVFVAMHGIGYRVASGHRLMLQIASCYWPILWPAPQPVTLTLKPGTSWLQLPVRQRTPETLRALVPSGEKPKVGMSVVREGLLERSIKIDLTSGEHISKFFVDGGVFGPIGRVRLNDTGTEMGDISERTYRIHPDDPLSAVATMDQDAVFEREDWAIRVKTTAKMTASKTTFYLTATVDCWDGDEPFHSVKWDHEIPRNGM